ncbi:MAG: UDP-N-acetylglucosamine 2-epimerase (non-hydrolyzing) [Porticoccus sp.]|jgi:UDP-N-acetylglucosamine 2-epimerase (non-hydrolysing)|nr:UDP-N-acetylglucosamine 2-epimerase (non-hydrolyzing) [Porticoccus sp.]
MKKIKVITVVGTRPEIIRLSRIIPALDKYCEHTLVHTDQNYDINLNQVFFDDLSIRKPDHFLNSAKDSIGPANTIGNIIIKIDEILQEIQPDAMLVLGDTNSCLSVIPAKRRKIPIFHMEAGNRCFDMRVPEETNRRIVDHTADINLTYSNIAREHLMREGISADCIIRTGSPMHEVLNYNMQKIESSNILSRLNITKNKYFAVSFHREENIEPEKSFNRLVVILNSLANDYSLPVIVSTHPRTRKKLDDLNVKFNSLIKFEKPMGYHDYIHLQMNAKAVLSDSGTITEESSILNFPALNIREAHERPEGMEEAAVMMVGLEIDRVRQALAILEHQSRGQDRILGSVNEYMTKNVSQKIVRIIHSYTDYVNRVVWKKY